MIFVSGTKGNRKESDENLETVFSGPAICHPWSSVCPLLYKVVSRMKTLKMSYHFQGRKIKLKCNFQWHLFSFFKTSEKQKLLSKKLTSFLIKAGKRPKLKRHHSKSQEILEAISNIVEKTNCQILYDMILLEDG